MALTWVDELGAMLSAARGDLGVFIALAALRHVENGREGMELGVLSLKAPVYVLQLAVAANSLRHEEQRLHAVSVVTRRPWVNAFTPEFLERFSARWAPVNAPNDPNGLNVNHADNLKRLALRYTDLAVTALQASIPPLPDPHA